MCFEVCNLKAKMLSLVSKYGESQNPTILFAARSTFAT